MQILDDEDPEAIAESGMLMYIFDMTPWVPQCRAEMLWGDFFECEADWYWSVRELPVLDVWLVTDGVGWISDGETRTTIAGGDCVLARPGASYAAGHDPSRPLGLIAVHFDLLGPDGARLEPSPSGLPPFVRRMEHSDLLRELLTRAVHAHKAGDSRAAGAWLQAALMEVDRQDRRRWPAGPLGDQARKIEEICERIRRHPERDVRVEELAPEMHVSPEHFSRLFRSLQGIPPRAFITRTRIDAAQRLLLTSSLSIARIADVLGYTSPYYFSRHFKAKVGLSPSGFRASRNPRVSSS